MNINFNEFSLGTPINGVTINSWEIVQYPTPNGIVTITQSGELMQIGDNSLITTGMERESDPIIEIIDFPLYTTLISVDFLSPVTSFSFDVYSHIFTSPLFYSGINELGESFTGFYRIPSGVSSVSITGTSINGFYFSNTDYFPVIMTMDNLSYESITEISLSGRVFIPIEEVVLVPENNETIILFAAIFLALIRIKRFAVK